MISLEYDINFVGIFCIHEFVFLGIGYRLHLYINAVYWTHNLVIVRNHMQKVIFVLRCKVAEEVVGSSAGTVWTCGLTSLGLAGRSFLALK